VSGVGTDRTLFPARDGRAAALLRQFAKTATTFIEIAVADDSFASLGSAAGPGCRVVRFLGSPEREVVAAREGQMSDVAADVHIVADAEDLDLESVLSPASVEPVVIRIDWPGRETAVLARLRSILVGHNDVRVFVEWTPGAPGDRAAEVDALLGGLQELGLDVFLLEGRDGGHVRCGRRQLLDAVGGAAATLCCVPITMSLDLCAFSHSSELGGAELCLAELVEQMTSRFGTLFTVVLPSDGPLRERVESMGASTVIIESPWWCADPALPASAVTEDELAIGFLHLRRALPELGSRSPDAVLTSTVTIPWGAVAAAALDRPHVWWVHEYGRRDHGFEFLYGYEESVALIVDASSHVIATSQAVREELFPGVPPEKCSVASYAPDVRPSGADVPAGFWRPGATRLIHTGRVVRTKGQEDALRAVKLLAEGGRDVELCVVGAMDPDAEYASRLLDYVRDAGIADRVHFLGSVADVIPLIREAHISLTCSRHEAYGRVTSEAMLLETPVIGTATGGTAELIQDGFDGFLYPPGDAAALADKVAFFVDHPDEIAPFGKRAADNMHRKIEADRVDTRFFDVCLRHKGGSSPRSAALARLSQQWRERTESALERRLLQREAVVRDLERRTRDLQAEFAERTEWALALQREITEMRSTFAWRVRRALKDPKRAWSTIRRRSP